MTVDDGGGDDNGVLEKRDRAMTISSSSLLFVESKDARNWSNVGCPFLGFFLDVCGRPFLRDVISSSTDP